MRDEARRSSLLTVLDTRHTMGRSSLATVNTHYFHTHVRASTVVLYCVQGPGRMFIAVHFAIHYTLVGLDPFD
jgi:hypothetical protein